MENRCRRAWCLIVVLVPVAWAQKQAVNPKVDQIFAQYNKTDSPGCAVGAAIKGETVLSAAYGMADLEHNVALTPGSVFEAGSVSKQFTAAAVLLLAQQGKLSLDDPVRKYIPEVPDYGAPLTIRHMINHTSGLRDWGSVEAIAGWPRTTRVYTHAHVLEIVSHQKALNYPPGAAYSYSNTGFNLAAILVSRVSGKSFPEFERDAIFSPLDMSSTQWRDDFQRIVHNRAIAYEGQDGKMRTLMPFENIYGNGGLLTTVGDLLRWNQNFTDTKVGGPALVKEQVLQGRLTDGQNIRYAAGLMTLEWRGKSEISHSGSTAGYRAWLGRYPDQGLSVAVLCNVASADATKLGHAVADIYWKDASAKTSRPKFSADPEKLRAQAGLYRSVRDHVSLSIEIKGDHLQFDHRETMQPVSSDEYELTEHGPRVEFKRDASGKVTGLEVADEIDRGIYYERVDRVNPSRAELEAMAGVYASDEAETTLTVTLEPGGLVVHRRPDTKIALTPTYQDGFNSTLGSVRFIRDSSGRIVELSVGESRVWDLRFKRLP